MLKNEVRKQTINNVVGNFIGHAGITYWVKYEVPWIHARGTDGYFVDFLVTGFLFSAILAAIFIFLYRAKLARGEIDGHAANLLWINARMTNSPWSAVLIIGLLGLISVAVLLGVSLLTVGPLSLSPLAVALAKGIWAAAAAGIIVPIAIYYAASPKKTDLYAATRVGG